MDSEAKKRNAACPELDSHRREIGTLYCVNRYTVKKIRDEINQKHNLTASVAQYRNRIDKWGFRKNLTDDQVVAAKILRDRRKGKESKVIISQATPHSIQAIVPTKQLDRSIKRREQGVPLVERLRKAITTPLPKSFLPIGAQGCIDETEMPRTFLTVRTPDPVESLSKQFMSLRYSTLQKLPIFKASNDLGTLFQRNILSNGITDVSTIEAHPSFTILRLIVWQVSNNFLKCFQLHKLLEKVEQMELWGPLFHLFSLENYSILATADMVIPVLYYRGKEQAAFRIFISQSYGNLSLYHYLEEGNEVTESGDSEGFADAPKHHKLRRYHHQVISDIISIKAEPHTPQEAVVALDICRRLNMSILGLLGCWDSLSFTPADIDNQVKENWRGGFSGRPKWSERPLLRRPIDQVESLLKFGIRDGVSFQLLDSILEDSLERTSVFVRYSSLPTTTKAELLGLFALAKKGQHVWDLISVNTFQTILRLASMEIANFMSTACIDHAANSALDTENDQDGDTWHDAAVLIYFANPDSPSANHLASIFLQTFGSNLLTATMTRTLKAAVNIYKTYIHQEFTLLDPTKPTQILPQKLEWLFLVSQRAGLKPDISATTRMWDLLCFTDSIVCSYSSNLYRETAISFIATLIDRGASLDDPAPKESHYGTSMYNHVIKLALSPSKPNLFVLCVENNASLDPLISQDTFEDQDTVVDPILRKQYTLNKTFMEAVLAKDIDRIRALWPQRFDESLQKPPPVAILEAHEETDVKELQAALQCPIIDPAALQNIALTFMTTLPHPIIAILYGGPIISGSGKLVPQDREKNACYDVLSWLFRTYFDNPGFHTTFIPPAAIKLLHRNTMDLIIQPKGDINFFQQFFRYGAAAELLPHDERFRVHDGFHLLSQLNEPSFMNISIQGLQWYVRGNKEIISTLLSAGYNINQAGSSYSTLLMAAIIDGNMNMVAWLLEMGADIFLEVRDPTFQIRNTLVNAPEFAVIMGRIDMVALFLEFDSNCRERAMEMAISQGKSTIAEMIKNWIPSSSSGVLGPNEEIDASLDDRLGGMSYGKQLESPSLTVKAPESSREEQTWDAEDVDAEMVDISSGEFHSTRGSDRDKLQTPQPYPNSRIYDPWWDDPLQDGQIADLGDLGREIHITTYPTGDDPFDTLDPENEDFLCSSPS